MAVRASVCAAALGVFACGAACAGWAMVREFDFARGDTLDAASWSVEQGFQRNRESQYYTPANIGIQDGRLVIEARREDVPNAAHQKGSRDWRKSAARAAYTSGSIVLREPVHFGRVEIVARSPSGKGVWPAIWLLHEGRGEYGEIDIFEAVGKHPDTVFGAVHFGRAAGTRENRGGHLILPGFEKSWRTHTVEWTPERIAIAVDGKPVFSFDPRDAVREGSDPLRRPMFLHVNLALGGSWGGEIDDAALPARFEIARIRIFRLVPDTPGEAAERAAAPSVPPPLADPVLRWGR